LEGRRTTTLFLIFGKKKVYYRKYRMRKNKYDAFKAKIQTAHANPKRECVVGEEAIKKACPKSLLLEERMVIAVGLKGSGCFAKKRKDAKP